MKKGFRIEIQKNLSEKEFDIAKKYADLFIKETMENELSWKSKTRGGWRSYLRRGIAGNRIGEGLFFRRASKNRRIFQIIKGNMIKIDPQMMKSGYFHDGILETECMCPHHEGGLKVKNNYGDIETEVYFEIGDIKG